MTDIPTTVPDNPDLALPPDPASLPQITPPEVPPLAPQYPDPSN